jgi:hypothetical protein
VLGENEELFVASPETEPKLASASALRDTTQNRWCFMSAGTVLNMEELSIVEGGPLYRIQLRAGLMKREAPRIIKRAVLFALVAWLPLLILSAAQGLLFANVAIPFVHDFAAYSRFLVAVPLLVVAEIIIGGRLAEVASYFVTSGLVPEHDYPDFDSAVADTMKLRDSTFAEVVILGITYASAYGALQEFSGDVSTWHALLGESGHQLTLAGYWYVLVAVPIFQFLTYRWLWRLFIWCKFLRRVSKLDLQLIPTHPDRAGGLSFLGDAHRAFVIIIFAIACTASGLFCREVLFQGVSIQSFKFPVAAYVVVCLLLFLGPLLMFAPKLLKVRRKGLLEYGALGTTYTSLFQEKWVKGMNPSGEPILGSSDIQSLANFGNSYDLVTRMRVFPFEPRAAVTLALAALLPMVPVLATAMPIKEVLKIASKVLG